MAHVPHYRLTMDYGRGATPRHWDYSTHEVDELVKEAEALLRQVLGDHLSPVTMTVTNLAKQEGR